MECLETRRLETGDTPACSVEMTFPGVGGNESAEVLLIDGHWAWSLGPIAEQPVGKRHQY
jgi:hypothetical protein